MKATQFLAGTKPLKDLVALRIERTGQNFIVSQQWLIPFKYNKTSTKETLNNQGL